MKTEVWNWVKENKAYLICIGIGFLVGRRSVATRVINVVMRTIS